MKSIIIFCALISISFAGDFFKYQDCGGSHMKVHNISITPLPIKLSQTHDIKVSADVEILQDLPTTAVARLKISKILKIGEKDIRIPIPCVDGDIGSCDMNVCELLNHWYKYTICPFFEKSQKKCQCPILKGTYKDTDVKVEVPFDKIKGVLAQIAAGDYDVQFHITDSSGNTMYACLNIHANLVKE